MDHDASNDGNNNRPQSIMTSACATLMATARRASTDVTNFVRRCHSARTDLAPVTRELSELLMVLQILHDYDEQQGREGGTAVPRELLAHLRPILANCDAVVRRVDGVLGRHCDGGGGRRVDGVTAPQWTMEGKAEVSELAKSLGVHRGVMGLVSDLVAVLVERGGAGDSDDADDDEGQARISGVLGELRALGSSILISYSNATLAREHFALQVHLGQIVTYAETLIRTESWEDAVRTMDRAQLAAAPGVAEATRSSVPVPAPLRRIGSSAAATADDRDDRPTPAYRNSGLENLLPMGPPENYDSNRPPSMFFTPNKSPEPGVGGSATGFIVMDGFINSDPNKAMGTSKLGTIDQGGRSLHATEARSRPIPRINLTRERSPDRPLTTIDVPPKNADGSRSQAERQPQPFAPGLEVATSPEKEVAIRGRNPEEVTEEALAFAQVPVHILGRLSVNLVGQLYPNNNGSRRPDQATPNHSLPSVKIDECDGDRGFDDAASDGTSDTGSLHDDNLQFSQIDLSKLPPASNSEPTPSSQTAPLAQPPPPNVDTLYRSHSHPASQLTDDSTLPNSSPPDTRSLSSARLKPDSGARNLRQKQSISTMNTETFRMQAETLKLQKPLPKAPIVYIPGYPGPFIKKKAVVVGNFSCGKTCLITRMSKGHFPRGKSDKSGIMESVKLSVDEEPIELSLWDIRGIDYDPTWLKDAHVALVCFSVNIGSTDSKGKHLGRWVAEVNRNCPGAAILLVGLKADIRFHAKSVEKLRRSGKALVTPEQGEQFRENIGASRYLECSARSGQGVLEVLGETARVAMQIRKDDNCRKARRPLSRIGRFFGFPSGASKESEDG